MATSACPKCSSSSFEIKINEPRGSRFKIYFIQCTSCGTVVGTMDYYDTATMLEKIAKKLGFDIHR